MANPERPETRLLLDVGITLVVCLAVHWLQMIGFVKLQQVHCLPNRFVKILSIWVEPLQIDSEIYSVRAASKLRDHFDSQTRLLFFKTGK